MGVGLGDVDDDLEEHRVDQAHDAIDAKVGHDLRLVRVGVRG